MIRSALSDAGGPTAGADTHVNDLYAVRALPDTLPDDPMRWAKDWLDEAVAKSVQRNPGSMTLATVDSAGRPAARMVLCKDFVPDPGYVVFYTNYNSAKAQQLDERGDCALVFHWDALGRQVRIEGQALRSPDAESDTYFASRDWGSQLGAWGSDQSAPLASRAALKAQVARRAMRLGASAAKNLKAIAATDRPVITRPPHWGGYRVWAAAIELWIEGKDRIHDRARWERKMTATSDDRFATGPWIGTRLQP